MYLLFSYLLLPFLPLNGASSPKLCARRTLGTEVFLGETSSWALLVLVFHLVVARVKISLRDEGPGKRDNNEINKSP